MLFYFSSSVVIVFSSSCFVLLSISVYFCITVSNKDYFELNWMNWIESAFPIVIIFPWLCSWDVCHIIICQLLYIHSWKPGICFHYHCAVDDECKESDTFWLADLIRLFVHYTILLSSVCKLIWRHWTYRMPVGYIPSSVWLRLSISSYIKLYIIQYVGLCVFSLPFSFLIIQNNHILSYYPHQIGSMNYYPLFRVRSLNNRKRCMSFYIHTKVNIDVMSSDP